MNAKEFHAPDMRQALNQVRNELGPEAVILSSKNTGSGIVVVASREYDSKSAYPESVYSAPAEKSSVANDQYATSPVAPPQTNTPEPANVEPQSYEDKMRSWVKKYGVDSDMQAVPAPASRAPQQRRATQERGYSHENDLPNNMVANREMAKMRLEMESLHRELAKQKEQERKAQQKKEQENQHWNDHQVEILRQEVELLRGLLSQRIQHSEWQLFSEKNPLSVELFKKLKSLGLSNELCRQLLSQVKNQSNQAGSQSVKNQWQFMMKRLSAVLPVKQSILNNQNSGQRIVALVGPTGSGKTTTIAKLAAQFVMENDAEDLALITTDTYRIGAHEQLRVLGKILGVPVKIASESSPLNQIINGLGRKKLILIDTAGVTPKNPEWQEQMTSLSQIRSQIEIYLMLACTHQQKVLQGILKHYEGLDLAGCILSKLDETESLGEAISVVIENKLPISCVTNGQNIPQDLHQANGVEMVKKAISLSRPWKGEEWQLAQGFMEPMESESAELAYIA